MILRIKGVKTVRSKGHTYHYHRKSGTRLPGEPGSTQFISELSSLNRTSNRTSTVPGSLGTLVRAYKSSPEFAALAPATKAKYQKVFDDLRGLDGMPLASIDGEFLYALRDKKMAQHKRAFANLMLAILQSVYNWGIRRSVCKVNPVQAVQKIRRPRSAPTINRPWRREELDTVLAEAPPWLRVPIALAAYTGLRESDVLTLPWSAYDGQAIKTRSQKTGVDTWVPCHPRLRELLDDSPFRNCQRLGMQPLHSSWAEGPIVVGARGRPIGRSTLTTAFFGLLKRLRGEGKVGPGLSFHGLRHTLGTALAEAGCDPGTIASILGHETTAMAEHYSRHANRRQLAAAAMAKLENQTENRDVTH